MLFGKANKSEDLPFCVRRPSPRGLGERVSLVKPQIKKILFFVGWSMSIRWEDINKYVLN